MQCIHRWTTFFECLKICLKIANRVDLRVETGAIGSVVADAVPSRHVGAERFRVVVKAVDKGREQWRLLEGRGRVCQSETNRAGGREHRFLPTSATNR